MGMIEESFNKINENILSIQWQLIEVRAAIDKINRLQELPKVQWESDMEDTDG